MTSIGNFIPTVCTPLLGMSHKASSGPNDSLRRSPTKRVKKLSAFRTVVASQVFLVKFKAGIVLSSCSRHTGKQFCYIDCRWSKNHTKQCRHNTKGQGEEQLND